MLRNVTTARRFYLFAGEHPSGGKVPTGNPATSTAYVYGAERTGAFHFVDGNLESHWPTIQARAIAKSGLPAFAYVYNHQGLSGSAASPNPTLDLLCAPPGTVQENSVTDTLEGGSYPSAHFGAEASFLAHAHGGELDGKGSDATVNPRLWDPTFTVKKGSFRGRLLPKQEFIGRLGSIVDQGSGIVDITLAGGVAHGESPSASFTCWIFGIQPDGATPADPLLTNKFVATADAVDPGKFRINLGAAWNGNAGRLGSGIICKPYWRILGLSNPTANIVRIELSQALDDVAASGFIWDGDGRGAVWLGDVNTTATLVNGRKTRAQNGLSFVPAIAASALVSFTAASKTIALSSGTWSRTPLAGEKLRVTGSASNNRTVTVESATSNTIVCLETLTNESAGATVTLHTLHLVEYDNGSAVNVTGYAGEGFAMCRPHWHPVFAGDCAGKHLYAETAATIADANTKGLAALASVGLGTDTIGNDESALVFSLGYNDADAQGDRQTALLLSWSQLVYETVQAWREQVATQLGTPGLTANDIVALVLPPVWDIDAYAYGAVGVYNDVLSSSQAAIIAQTRVAVQRMQRAALVEWGDLERGELGGATYSAATELAVGDRLWATLQSVLEQAATTGTDIGLPIYFLCGQSQTASNVPAITTLPQPAYGEQGDPDYNGSWYDATYTTVVRSRGCLIWNELTGVPEEYAPVKNAVTYPSRTIANHPEILPFISVGPPLGGSVGPELTLLLELRKRHPEGVLLVKLAVPSASLQVVTPPGLSTLPSFDPGVGDLSTDLLSLRDKVFAWCYLNGRVPDVKAFIFDQGESDAFVGVASNYQAALTAFIEWVRDNFQTTASRRAPLPFVIGRVQSHPRTDPTALPLVQTVQAAQDAVAASGTNVAIASMQGLPISSDNIHRTYHALLIAGQRLNDALDDTSLLQDGFEQGDGVSINPEIPHGDPASEGQASGMSASSVIAGASAAAAGTDTSSLLAQLDEAISAFLSNGAIQSYSINGRQVTRASLPDLVQLRATLRSELAATRGGAQTYFRRGTV